MGRLCCAEILLQKCLDWKTCATEHVRVDLRRTRWIQVARCRAKNFQVGVRARAASRYATERLSAFVFVGSKAVVADFDADLWCVQCCSNLLFEHFGKISACAERKLNCFLREPGDLSKPRHMRQCWSAFVHGVVGLMVLSWDCVVQLIVSSRCSLTVRC